MENQELKEINKKISEYEKKFGGTYQEVFMFLENQELGEINSLLDTEEWRQLIVRKNQILKEENK